MARPLALLWLAAALAAGVVPSAASQYEGPTLQAFVGPGFEIYVTNEAGEIVRQIDPGTYTILVDDRSAEHNFHLSGPGVNQATEVDAIAKLTWTVTLVDGVYRFVCDPHASFMRGSITVGNPPPPAAPAPAPAPKLTRLIASVGPGTAISLRKASGGVVRTLNAGRYSIAVRDRSRTQNFHLRGPGVNRKTGIPFVGTVTWNLTLGKGRYTFASDAAPTMRGAFRVN